MLIIRIIAPVREVLVFVPLYRGSRWGIKRMGVLPKVTGLLLRMSQDWKGLRDPTIKNAFLRAVAGMLVLQPLLCAREDGKCGHLAFWQAIHCPRSWFLVLVTLDSPGELQTDTSARTPGQPRYIRISVAGWARYCYFLNVLWVIIIALKKSHSLKHLLLNW